MGGAESAKSQMGVNYCSQWHTERGTRRVIDILVCEYGCRIKKFNFNFKTRYDNTNHYRCLGLLDDVVTPFILK